MKQSRASATGRTIPAALFLLALTPRLPGLRLFLTTDEPFFAQQAAEVIHALLRGDFRSTYWHFYPGLTISWLDGLGMLVQWGVARLIGAAEGPFIQFIKRDVLDLLVALRTPYALLSALFVVAVYWLMLRLAGRRVALVGALLVAWDSFFLAHSRVAHGDGPVAVFMGISALAFFVHLRNSGDGPLAKTGDYRRRRPFITRWLLLSAACGSLAALTKSPGPFMLPFVVLLGLGDWLRCSRRARSAVGVTPAADKPASISSAFAGSLQISAMSQPAVSAARARWVMLPATPAPSIDRSSLKISPSNPMRPRRIFCSHFAENPAGWSSTAG